MPEWETVVTGAIIASTIGKDSIKNIEDGLVELITNSDDSYNQLGKENGVIEIDYGPGRKLTVRDFAEGIHADKMRSVLGHYGGQQSGDGSRGSQGRGMNDFACLCVGKTVYESIRDNRYTKYELRSNTIFMAHPSRDVTARDRKRLGIPEGNGTVITGSIRGDPIKFTQFNNLVSRLSLHVCLRKICSSKTVIRLRRIGSNGEVEEVKRLIYRPPNGELVVDEEFEVEGDDNSYPCTARLRIWKAEHPIPECSEGEGWPSNSKDYEQFGIRIESVRGVHQLTLFDRKFENELGHRYFGILKCDYIDYMVKDFQNHESSGIDGPSTNPWQVIDTNRRGGLDETHPFTIALFKRPREILGQLIEGDKQDAESAANDISDEHTKKRLNEASKQVAKIFADLHDIDPDDLKPDKIGTPTDQAAIDSGFFFNPDSFKLGKTLEKKLRIRAHKDIIGDGPRTVIVSAEQKRIIGIPSPQVILVPDKTNDDYYVGRIRLKGLKVDTVILEAVLQNANMTRATAIGEVTEEYGTSAPHEFTNDIEFGEKNYTVRNGCSKKIWLYAKYPEVVVEETRVELSKTEHLDIQCPTFCILKPVPRSNFAIGSVKIEGRTLGGKTEITAILGDRRAITNVKVKGVKGGGGEDSLLPPFETRIVEYKLYNNERAKWDVEGGRPWTLLISAAHQVLKRHFAGPNVKQTAAFNSIVIEIIAEWTATRYCLEEARQKQSFKDPRADIVTNTVLSRLRRQKEKMLNAIHEILVTNKEATPE